MKAEARRKLEEDMRRRFDILKDSMGERVMRHRAATEAEAIGCGGIMIVHRATSIARSTIGAGLIELRGARGTDEIVKVRRKGSGRRPHEVVHPELPPALQRLVDPATRGDPESPLRWTNKSTHALSAEMWNAFGFRVSNQTVARLLKQLGYSLQATHKTVEGKQHPDRNAQFEFINAKAEDCIAREVPFISVDTKKKELVGNFKNGGLEWQPEDVPDLVGVHDFPHQAIGEATATDRSCGSTSSSGSPKKIPAKEMRALNVVQDTFHGDWNYTIHPRTEAR